MALTGKDLWDKYVTELTNYITSGQFDKENQVICFSGNTLMVDLADADSEITNYNVYNIGNLIPKNSPAYAPQGDLIGTYSSFLNYIDLDGDINPNLDSQINIAAGNLTNASNNFLQQTQKSIADFTTMKQVMPNLDWPTYIQQYGAVYTEAENYMLSCESEYDRLLNQKYGVNAAIIQNAKSRVGFTGGAQDIINKNSYNMLGKVGSQAPLGSVTTLPGQTPAAQSSSLTEIKIPGYQLDSSFTTAYQQWQTKSANGIVDVGPIEVNGTTNASQYSEFGWNASIDGSCFGDFFSVFGSGSASGQTIKQSWQSTNFNLKMSYTGLQTFKIGPLSWFQQSFITNYKDKLLKNAPNFFGENGSLNLLPYEIIVGFEPKLELTLDNSDYNDFKNSFNASATASLSIGPFRIGSASTSTYSQKNNVTFSDETSTITVGPIKSTIPLLLGVICSKL